jgi:hypothetical protein
LADFRYLRQIFKLSRSLPLLMKLLAALVALILIPAGICLAAPLPPETIVNYTAKECAEFFSGDECSDCAPQAGWERLGPGAPCPTGFEVVEAEGICHGLQTSFCCTEGHSGAAGNCTMLVKNDLTRECALAEDISCSLPAGWMTMPERVSPSEWLCPLDYNWTTVSCTDVENAPDECASGDCTSGNFTIGNSAPVNPTSGNSNPGNSTSLNINSGNSTSANSTPANPTSVNSNPGSSTSGNSTSGVPPADNPTAGNTTPYKSSSSSSGGCPCSG